MRTAIPKRLRKLGKAHTRVDRETDHENINHVYLVLSDHDILNLCEHTITINPILPISRLARLRLNQASNQWNLGFKVFKLNGVDYIRYKISKRKYKTTPFTGALVIAHI